MTGMWLMMVIKCNDAAMKKKTKSTNAAPATEHGGRSTKQNALLRAINHWP